MSSQSPLTVSPDRGFMLEKLATFLFAGILGTMLYHFVAAALLRDYFSLSPIATLYWYVPLIVLPDTSTLAPTEPPPRANPFPPASALLSVIRLSRMSKSPAA